LLGSFLSSLSFTSCMDIKSLYIRNKTGHDIEIVYDDRFYLSKPDADRTLSKKTLKPDSLFFLGPDTSLTNIWPDFIQINSKNDTIVLKGRGAIKSCINDADKENCFITIK
jgi:hypothetical protein